MSQGLLTVDPPITVTGRGRGGYLDHRANSWDRAADHVAITKKAEYAITILVDLILQPNESFTTAREIADRQGIPSNFVPQIVSILSRVGWLEGMRGPGGGVRPIIDLERLTVKEVIETVEEGPIAITRCLFDDGKLCSNRPVCPLHDVWLRAQEAMLRVLEETTVGDLAKSKQQLMSKVGA
ncbi:MAG: Rrf2 family transcriptional regulator [Firmicutes bacterium]|nr:Rrf2 family transcriptional regulator [Bacillota bacterium]